MAKPTATSLNQSLGAKLSLVTGAGAVAAAMVVAPTVASAAIIASTGLPLGPPGTDGENNWDVDGDGTPDFELRNSSTEAMFNDLNGGRLVVPGGVSSGGVARLASGITVGATLATGYKFHAGAQNNNTITSSSAVEVAGWNIGDVGFFGFKFTNVSGTHYGWGELDIFGDTDASGFSILRAYYENEADVAIVVGDEGSTATPEPASTIPAIVLLAAGAAGVRAWRRRKAA